MPTAVLVLEDDLNMQELLVECLEDAGYEAVGAPSADKALALAGDHRFDLVVSDVRMAGSTDGLGALAALKGRQPELRCIVITGYADEDAPRQAIEIQVDDYVHKPFTFAELLTTVRRVLTSNQERRGYKKLLSSLAAAPRRLADLADQAGRDQAARQLDSQRNRFYQAFFLAIRSNLILQAAAMGIWDRLEELEEAAEAGDDPRPLAEGFRSLIESVTAGMNLSSRGERGPHAVEKAQFIGFFTRIRNGQISAEQLRVAASLRCMPAAERAEYPELEELHRLLWGE